MCRPVAALQMRLQIEAYLTLPESDPAWFLQAVSPVPTSLLAQQSAQNTQVGLCPPGLLELVPPEVVPMQKRPCVALAYLGDMQNHQQTR
eukprot:5635935-Amphidinium_carterae.2